ncbi:MAG: 4Fe-4S dicluster domain-containing protein [Armatimonadetes bacterium]|nr:4Fe-4S dicluster domain-containing protein [Armatimonadota bacterium]
MLSQQMKALGVVGAGGAGFPTYVKAESRAELVLANGAECEPLVHKDVELLEHFPAEVVQGLLAMMAACGASSARFGVKSKNAAVIEALRPHLESRPIELLLMGDFYPAGDEYELVYLATGRLIPPGGLPLHVGCVVNNVETLYNVHQATQGQPVTHKFVSVTGAVSTPSSFRVPLGTPFRDLVRLAGGVRVPEFATFVSGIMMGRLCSDLEEVVTKTTAGLILLPADHYLVGRRNRPAEAMHRIGRSACDQCSYCTELCPRYLLGYEIMPHKVMRSLAFSAAGAANWNQWAELCCACGLCTLYACPEDLYPREACLQARADMRAAGTRFVQQKEARAHPVKEGRRVPLAQLRRRLKLEEWESPAPFQPGDFVPERVRIPLQQHVGRPARATVAPGERVERGSPVGRVAPDELGADVHSSIPGVVERVTESYVEIRS